MATHDQASSTTTPLARSDASSLFNLQCSATNSSVSSSSMMRSPNESDAATNNEHSRSSTTSEVLGAAEPATLQWSNRKITQDFMDEKATLLALTVPIGSAYVFREMYRAYPSSHHRILLALAPAVLGAPVLVASVAGFDYLNKRIGDYFEDEKTLAKPLGTGALAGVLWNFRDSPRAIARRAAKVSALYVALGAGVNHFSPDEQDQEQGAERAIDADADSSSSLSS